MTEDEARDWLATRASPGAMDQLTRFTDLLRGESERQSLIARSTFDQLWSRHIVDSAQLVELAPASGKWLDIGSGGGLPGLVVGILRDAPLTMSEPRRKRAEFLQHAVDVLELRNIAVTTEKVQTIHQPAAIISARAVARVTDIFAWTAQIVSRETRYILPRGQSWQPELEIARRAWQGRFHVEQSLTDPNSGIIIAEAVAPR